jgi:hypothetical protein
VDSQYSSDLTSVSHAAHMGGLLAGIVLVVIGGPHVSAVADPADPNRLYPRISSILAVVGRMRTPPLPRLDVPAEDPVEELQPS